VIEKKNSSSSPVANVGGCMYARFSGQFSLVASLFRPCVLGFLGLALAVALCGFAYKISLYQPNSGMRSNVVKLWDKRQQAQANQNAVNNPTITPDQTHLPAHRFPDPWQYSRAAIAYLAAPPPISLVAACAESHLPFRSPPTNPLA
jgi:hypothetical protein